MSTRTHHGPGSTRHKRRVHQAVTPSVSAAGGPDERGVNDSKTP